MPTNFETPFVTNPTPSDGPRPPSPMSSPPYLNDVWPLQVWVPAWCTPRSHSPGWTVTAHRVWWQRCSVRPWQRLCCLWYNLQHHQNTFWPPLCQPPGLPSLTNVCASIIFFRLTSLFQKFSVISQLFNPADDSLWHELCGANVLPNSFV